jgi:hypothetical protein
MPQFIFTTAVRRNGAIVYTNSIFTGTEEQAHESARTWLTSPAAPGEPRQYVRVQPVEGFDPLTDSVWCIEADSSK